MTAVQSILAGQPRAIARAATIIENRNPEAEQLLQNLWLSTGKAEVYGITGPPGAGKSTFVTALVRELRKENKTVGVIAVDPTSPYSGGAILGDRIRMQEHHGDPGVFIRSMATRGKLGGIAPATMDLTLLLDAAGFHVILVETVGSVRTKLILPAWPIQRRWFWSLAWAMMCRPSKPAFWKSPMFS